MPIIVCQIQKPLEKMKKKTKLIKKNQNCFGIGNHPLGTYEDKNSRIHYLVTAEPFLAPFRHYACLRDLTQLFGLP